MGDEIWDQYEEEDETTYAQKRSPERTYASQSFPIDRPSSSDFGQRARFVRKVFDETNIQVTLEGSEWIIRETDKGRFQVQLIIAREAGRVKELWIQRVPQTGSAGKIKVLFNLTQPNVGRLLDLLRVLPHIPIEGETVRADDSLIRELFTTPEPLVALYQRDPDRLRQMISDDESAQDLVAVAHRRRQVDIFRQLLNDDNFFEREVNNTARKRPEDVWQAFFERNPWILGVTLAGQLLTSWSQDKLEQVVIGPSIGSVGKRTDALLRTSGRIRSMVFAEFKTHKTPLLSREPRTGCWAVSTDLADGIAQLQGTVHRAVMNLRDKYDRMTDKASDGSDILGKFTYLIRPRQFLIIGRLDQLVGREGGDHTDRILSFELFRRQVSEPEILTYDELLARAEWFVETSSTEENGGPA